MDLGETTRDPEHRRGRDCWLCHVGWRKVLTGPREWLFKILPGRFVELFEKNVDRCECPKESRRQKKYSPRRVFDNEPIVYAVIDPLQFSSGSLKQIKSDKLKHDDLSVCRSKFTSGEAARKSIVVPQIAKDPSRIDMGYLWATAREIRGIQLPNVKLGAFCVVDDGLEQFRAHAVLGYATAPDGVDVSKLASLRQSARGDLLLLFQRRGLPRDWSNWVFN